jgi:hypothetical protein
MFVVWRKEGTWIPHTRGVFCHECGFCQQETNVDILLLSLNFVSS